MSENSTAPNSSGRPEQSQRELIVLTRPDAGVRSGAPGLSSVEGADVGPLADLLARAGATMEPLFPDVSTQRTAAASPMAEDDARYHCVHAADDQLDRIAAELNQNDLVEAAYVKPAAELATLLHEPPVDYNASAIEDMQARIDSPPAATPDFTGRQGYLNTAPAGVDARYAWRFAGGRGGGIRVIDLEWGWRFTHEDLGANQGGVIAGTADPVADSNSTNHGTAVLGEISGDDNSLGITGIAPDARISAVAFSMPSAKAIRTAADNLSAGDIILLEIHRPGPRFNFEGRDDQRGYIGIEWWPDDFAAIRYAVNRGVIVVEAAGNGAENLDDAIYNTRPSDFPSTWRNPFNTANPSSQAVLVGAGAPPPGTHGADHGPDRSRLDFSNHGRRVDAQGWGREVTTTGYGDLQGGNNVDRWYTDRFSGTSSASPIVVGALACVQGALRAEGQALLTPQGAIDILRSTGSPQTDAPGRPAGQRIGNRPDLKAMLDRLVRPSTTYTGVWRAGTDAHYLWVNVDWNNFVAKWQELAGQNLRLVDLEIDQFGSETRYSGVWRAGNDPYYLWVNASWDSFVAKWQELSAQNLRLIDLEIRKVGSDWRYSGVWRGGSDGHYLWVNATWDSFVAKWQELSAQNLRLVDIAIVKIGSEYRYSGVWRSGSDAHYLWVNATWDSFVAKWQELGAQNLRLTKIVRTRVGSEWRYSGIWRAGTDAYYLWVNASWPSFVDKWQELAGNGLRLVDFDVNTTADAAAFAAPPDAPPTTGLVAETGDGAGHGGGRISGPEAHDGADGYGGGETAPARLTTSSVGAMGAETASGAGFGGGSPATVLAADGFGGGDLG
jgi:Subtilase family/Bacterial tandem repeat domain 1